MQEPFDWEQAMEATRRSATAASRNSEHAVAGMAKLLRELDRYYGKLSSLTSAIDKLEGNLTQKIAHTQTALNRDRGDSRPSWRLPALGLLAAFVVGVACGGYFVN